MRTALGALLFGFFDAAQIRLQGRGVPAELVQTLPYLIVIIVLAGLGLADRRRAQRRSPVSAPTDHPTALLLVDVTNSFFLEGMPNYYPAAAADVLEPLRRLLDAARAPDASSSMRSSSIIPASTTTNGASCRAIISSATPTRPSFPASSRRARAKSWCGKRRYSAFFATDLALFLHEQKIERVVIAGVKTNVCIRATRAGRVRQRLRCRRAARGDQLQSAASRRGVARGHRSIHRRGGAARRSVGDAGMIRRRHRLRQPRLRGAARSGAARQTRPRPSSRVRANGRGSADRRPMSRARWSRAASSTRRPISLDRRGRRGAALPRGARSALDRRRGSGDATGAHAGLHSLLSA